MDKHTKKVVVPGINFDRWQHTACYRFMSWVLIVLF
jgi:hypothetical protein